MHVSVWASTWRNCEWLIKAVIVYLMVAATWITVVILELIHASKPDFASDVCGFSFFLAVQWKTKNTSQFFNHQCIQKTKKTLFFLAFSRSKPKKPKEPRQNQKNQTWASDQTFSEKFWFFVFFGFLEVLVILYFLWFNSNQENSEYKVRQLRS